MTLEALIPPLHAAATLFMVGLIWFVQVVHYPLLGLVPAGARVAYEREHVARTGRVVVPVMVAEAATAVALAWLMPGPWTALGLALLAAIWLVTALVQVPQHRLLSERGGARTVERLVRGNWVRTLAWSARGLVALAVLESA